MKEVLLYGYSKEFINIIKNELEKNFNEEFLFISTDDKENKISQIIENKIFLAEEITPKLFMFLNFSKEEIQKTLQIFPKDMKRPYFCGLTKHNYHWTIDYLIKHLEEERQEIMGKLLKMQRKNMQSNT